jgi:hypothetical protein
MTFEFRPAVRENVPRLRTHELTPRACRECGEEFVPIRKSKGIYCSRQCANAGAARQSATTRGDAQRGRGEGRTYRKLNGRHEHRVIAEQKLGRTLRKGEVVHHIDGDRLNNAPENLAVMTQAEHMRQHGLAIPGKPLAHKPWEKRRRT